MVANKKTQTKGFTLLEIIVVLGIFATISFLAFPTTIGQIQQGKIENTINDMTSLIFVQQQNAYSGLNAKDYGVAFTQDTYTLFIGTTLATAESSEEIELPHGMTIENISLTGGATEFSFDKGSLKPSSYGTLEVTDGLKQFTFEINREGLINVY